MVLWIRFMRSLGVLLVVTSSLQNTNYFYVFWLTDTCINKRALTCLIFTRFKKLLNATAQFLFRNQKFWGLDELNSPNIYFLWEQEVVVEVIDGTIHRVTVSHFHHGCSGLTLHELDLQEVKDDKIDQFSAITDQPVCILHKMHW